MSKILRAKQAPPTGAIRSPGSGGSLFSWNAMFETFRDIDIVDFGVSRSLLAVCAQCSLSTFAGRKDAMSAVHSLHCGKATSDWRARSRLYFDMWTRIDTSWKYTGPECDYPRLFQTLSIVVEMLQVVTIWSVPILPRGCSAASSSQWAYSVEKGRQLLSSTWCSIQCFKCRLCLRNRLAACADPFRLEWNRGKAPAGRCKRLAALGNVWSMFLVLII